MRRPSMMLWAWGGLATGLLAIGQPANGATYRCEVEGKVVYTDAPCPVGRQREVALPDDTPDAAAQRAAREREARDVRRADKAVAEARKRQDADAKRRAEIAVAEHKAEQARLKKEAAEAKKEAARKSKVAKTQAFKAKTVGGATAAQ